MALGLCCQWLNETSAGFKNILVCRSLRKSALDAGKYTNEKINQVYSANVNTLAANFSQIIKSGIRSFRISSSLFPLFDLVPRELWDNPPITRQLKTIGDLAKRNNIRLTMHPGQFTVLSTNDSKILKNSTAELEHHGWILDQMGVDQSPFYSINIHGGKANQDDTLVKNINALPTSVKARLTLENCEFAYPIFHLKWISDMTRVPLCYDSHHHGFNPGGLSPKMAMELATSTWPTGVKPLTHLSNSKMEHLNSDVGVAKLRQHSDFIHTIPDYQLEAHKKGAIDIDIEAKMKNLAIFDLVKKFGISLV